MNALTQKLRYLACNTPFLKLLVLQYREKKYAGLLKTSLSDAFQCMEDFGYGNLSDKDKEVVLADMRRWLKKYRYSFYEYFAYNFIEKQSDEERLEFISNYERRAIIKKFNSSQDIEICASKAKTAEKYADFLKRDYCVVESLNDVDKLSSFLSKHKRVILKPVAGSLGRDVRIVDVTNEDDVEALASSLIKEYSFYTGHKYFGAIVEEVVVSDERLAKLHPQSVNTVRITTIRLDTRTVIFEPFLRVGRGNSCVDNAGAGGIICPLDIETGVVTAARDEQGISYETQPETGERLIGFQVPRWNEAKEFVQKAAQVVPTLRITGWDVALSQNGWVLIEANSYGEWVTQEATRTGLRSKITPILQELGK